MRLRLIALLLSGSAAALAWLPLVQSFGRPACCGGEAVMAAAFGQIALFAALWLLLGVMLVLGRGGMPKGMGWLAALFLPVAGLALLLAEGSGASRPWAVAGMAVVPPLIAGYAAWAGVPWLRRRLPAALAGPLAWGMTALFTLGALAAVLG